MKKAKSRKHSYKPGQVYLVDSFCGVRHKVKIKRLDSDGFGFWATLVDKRDIKRLIDAGVPLAELECIEKCEFFVFDFHVVKKSRRNKK